MNRPPLRKVLPLTALFLFLWPLVGWISLYAQYEHALQQDRVLPERVLNQHPDLTLSPGELQLQLIPLPSIRMTGVELSVEGLDESVRVQDATWRGQWYSAWLFHWVPDRFILHRASLIQDMDLSQELELTDAWDLLELMHQPEDLLSHLNAVDIQALSLTLVDPASENFVDVQISGELRRLANGDLALQSISDLSGDGWIDHGFVRLHGRWQPQPQGEPVRFSNLDTHLEFATSTRPYGFYQWSAEAEDLTVDGESRRISADQLILGQGRSEGTSDAPDEEHGERTRLLNLSWQADDPLWRAESVQRAAALAPHSADVQDIRWLLDSDHWRTGGSDQVGRTRLTWELNLRDDTLDQISLEAVQGGGYAQSLNEWRADYAELTLSVYGNGPTRSLSGWGAVNSDTGSGTIRLDNAEFTEQRGESDTIWLYLDAEAGPGGLYLNDVTGSLRGEPVEHEASLTEWLDCYDAATTLLIAIVTYCTQP